MERAEKEVWAESNSYENGKDTHTYRRLLLTAGDPADKAAVPNDRSSDGTR